MSTHVVVDQAPSVALGPRLGVELVEGGVQVRSNGQLAHLHPQWLRDQSTEPGQIDPSNWQRLFTPLDIPADLAVTASRCEGDRLIVDFSDGHRAHLCLNTIAQHLGWESEPEAPPPPEPWVGDPDPFPWIDWIPVEAALDDRPGADIQPLIDYLDAFSRLGFVVFRNVPAVAGTVAEVANRLGYLVGQNFGQVFNVRVEPDPTDLAYTSIELLAHTDLPYRQPPPGIQLFHCLTNGSAGGDSTVVDGLAAWQAMTRDEPEMAAALTEVVVEYRYDVGFDTVVNRGHVFEVDRADAFRGIRYNTKLDTPSPADPRVGLWYEARRWLAHWLNHPDNRTLFRLNPGDLLMADNHRVLHGRTAFGDGNRHLQGCYIEHDGTDTMYRLAYRRAHADQRSAINGSGEGLR